MWERALGLYFTRQDFKPSMVGWAVEKLQEGASDEATVLLAGADHEDDAEVLKLFRKAAAVQGIQLPGKEQEHEWLERWICGELVARRMEPNSGLTKLYQIWADSQYDRRFGRWLLLSESVALLEDGYEGGLDPFHEMKLENLDTVILNEAKDVLGAQGAPQTRPV